MEQNDGRFYAFRDCTIYKPPWEWVHIHICVYVLKRMRCTRCVCLCQSAWWVYIRVYINVREHGCLNVRGWARFTIRNASRKMWRIHKIQIPHINSSLFVLRARAGRRTFACIVEAHPMFFEARIDSRDDIFARECALLLYIYIYIYILVYTRSAAITTIIIVAAWWAWMLARDASILRFMWGAANRRPIFKPRQRQTHIVHATHTCIYVRVWLCVYINICLFGIHIYYMHITWQLCFGSRRRANNTAQHWWLRSVYTWTREQLPRVSVCLLGLVWGLNLRVVE